MSTTLTKSHGTMFQPWGIPLIQRGAKTQTQRMAGLGEINEAPNLWRFVEFSADGRALFVPTNSHAPGAPSLVKCPYGQVGDWLYVKHRHWRGGGPPGSHNDQVWDEWTRTTRWESGREIHDHSLQLDADGKHVMLTRRSGMLLPRWAARDWLQITDIRMRRVQEISEADVRAEGVPGNDDRPCDAIWCDQCAGYGLIDAGGTEIECRNCETAVDRFRNIWDLIHAKPKPVYQRFNGVKTPTHVSHPWKDIQEDRVHRGKPWYVRGNPWEWAISFARKDGE